MNILDFVSLATALVSLGSMLYLWRRKEDAAVKLKELEVDHAKLANTTDHVTSADKLVDLIEKANEKALAKQTEYYERTIQIQEKSYEKVLAKLAKLERAIRSINTCEYRHQCPVLTKLHDTSLCAEQQRTAENG